MKRNHGNGGTEDRDGYNMICVTVSLFTNKVTRNKEVKESVHSYRDNKYQGQFKFSFIRC